MSDDLVPNNPWNPGAAMTTFNLGDIVRLKSGGPAMVVTGERDPFDMFPCAWFAGDQYGSDSFPIEALIPLVACSYCQRFAPEGQSGCACGRPYVKPPPTSMPGPGERR